MIIEPDEFAIRYAELSDDEQEVLSEILRRTEVGSEQYGPLNLDTDPRDFKSEAADEAVDLMFYVTAEAIRSRRERASPYPTLPRAIVHRSRK